MSIKALLLFAGAAFGSSITRFSCGAPEPTEQDLAIAQQFALEEAAAAENGFSIQAAISVDVWFHAVSASQSTLSSVSLTTWNEFLRLRFPKREHKY